MSAHTPGPWEVITGVKCVGEPEACVLTGRDAVAVYADDPSTARANARLIAAAPDAVELLRDLLNAHEGAVNVSDDPFPDDLDRSREWLERVHAVLAKAEGGR